MKSNRFLTFILSGAMVLPMAALAQTSNSATASGDSGSTATAPVKHDRGAKFAQELNLTPDQQEALKSIRQNERQQFQAIKNDSSLTPDQKKAKIKDLRKTSHEQMMAKLTPEQQQKFKEMRKEHRGRKGHGRKGEAAEGTQS